MRSEFLNAAQAELDEGFEYYESLQPDLGFRFVSKIKKAVLRIESHPKAWHPLSKNTKRCLVNGFPLRPDLSVTRRVYPGCGGCQPAPEAGLLERSALAQPEMATRKRS